MSRPKRPIIAICYDFDGTLSPGNMQDHDYIPGLKLSSRKFWLEAKTLAEEQDADEILAYMGLMIEKATRSSGVQITRKAFQDYGRTVPLFKGVQPWFQRVNAYGGKKGALVQHYIISSGIKEMIEGTAIAGRFQRIYASSFMYDQNGVAVWPALAVNFTAKTQFLFRINKGVPDVWDNERINQYIPADRRPVPFSRIIYIGDGTTDIPCMRLVKLQGGYSIAVYRPGSTAKKALAERLLKEDRVHFVAPADYRERSKLDRQVKLAIDKMMADHVLSRDSSRKA